MADKRVLSGVPPVGFYGTVKRGDAPLCPEDFTFAACLRAVAEYLGVEHLGCEHIAHLRDRPVCCGYKHLLALSGQSFSHSFNPSKWDFGNSSSLRVADDIEALLRDAVRAAGYECRIVANEEHADEVRFSETASSGELGDLIVESVDAGRPVLALGVVGPPEWCYVNGYEDGGEILIGRSYFQEFAEFADGIEKTADGSFRKAGWAGETWAVLVVTNHVGTQSLPGVYEESLRRGLAVMEASNAGGFPAGAAAYRAWMQSLHADTFPPEAHPVHRSHVGEHAEARAYLGDHFAWAADALPAASEALRLAAGACWKIHDLMWRVWEQECVEPDVSSYHQGSATAFARPEVRARAAIVVDEARRWDGVVRTRLREAVDALEGQAEGRPGRPPSHILEGMPYFGFDVHRTGGVPKTTYLCAATEALLAYLGEPAEYHLLMAASGAAFRLTWNADRWDGGNVSMLTVGEDPLDSTRAVFRATGWTVEILGNSTWQTLPRKVAGGMYRQPDALGERADYVDEAAMTQAVVDSLRYREYPVVAIGVVFPPEHCIACGYEEGGRVLVGRSHFQDWPINASTTNVDSSGLFHSAEWYGRTAGVAILRHKTAKPSALNVYRQSIEDAVKLITTPKFRDHYHGVRAYEAWADALCEDAEFDTDRGADLADRLMCHNDAFRAVREGRRAAGMFLGDVARDAPAAAAPALAAADIYRREDALLDEMAAVLGGYGYGPETERALADAGNRSRIVPIIREAAGLESQASHRLHEAAEALRAE